MANERLEKRVADLLDGSLGLNVFPGPIALVWHSGEPGLFRDNPYMAGLKVGVFYVLICCGLPWLLFSASFIQKPSWSLTFLQIYGGIWSCWATTSTRITSSSILKIIESNIIPELSGRTAGRIDRELRRRFRRSRLLCVSWGIAFVGATLAAGLIYHDVSVSSKPSKLEIILWFVGWALLFATSAKVVIVSRFYRIFAANLNSERERLYALDPARSNLVISVASIAQRMLLFWLGIAISIALVIPFGVKDDNWGALLSFRYVSTLSVFDFLTLFKLNLTQNWFMICYTLLTGIFSIGVGTIVFLRSEAAIRYAVQNVTRSTLHSIEREVAELLRSLPSLDEAAWKRLTALNALHKEVSVAGSYRSLIVSGLSVMVPFVIPVVVSWFPKK